MVNIIVEMESILIETCYDNFLASGMSFIFSIQIETFFVDISNAIHVDFIIHDLLV